MHHHPRPAPPRRSAPRAPSPAARAWPGVGPEPLETRVLLSVELLRDFIPETFDANPQSFLAHGGAVYFSAVSAEFGRELWRTDGTPAGTRLVRDVIAGPGHSFAYPVAAVGDRLLFAARSTTAALYADALYTTDGTDAGTLRFNLPGLAPGGPSPMAHVGGVLYFAASDHSVWRTDGTPAGTWSLPARVSPNRVGPAAVATADGVVYFAGTDPAGGDGLWRTDGTASGTRLVKDTSPGAGGQYLRDFVVAGGLVYFATSAGPWGPFETWRTDGTDVGTFRVQDLLPAGAAVVGSPEPARPFAPPYAAARHGLLFLAADARHGTEVWATDGTPAGTTRLTERPDDVPAREQFELTSHGGYAYFLGTSADGRRELVRSDGTREGTVVVKDLGRPADWDTWPWGTWAGGLQPGPDGLLYFGAGGNRWRSDGTPEGTFVSPPGRTPLNAVRTANGRYVFAMDHPVFGTEPVSSTGLDASDDASIALLADVNSMPKSGNPSHFARLGNVVLFSANEPDGRRVMYRTDGTAAGTRRVFTSAQNAPYISGPALDLGGGRLLFAGYRPSDGNGVWVTDGTEAGTRHLLDLPPSSIRAMAPDPGGRHAYFTTTLGGLWRTDGTAAGTVAVVPDSSPLSAWALLGGINGRFLFHGNTRETGTEIYVTDGTPQGTRMLADMRPGPAYGAAGLQQGIVFNDALYFGAYDGQTGDGLWKTDGTAAGTTLVQPATNYSSAFALGPLYVFNGLLHYSRGNELWRTDGTAAGTAMWGTLPPDTFVDEALVWNGAIYLDTRVARPGGRRVIYRSDGTAAGTSVLKDLVPATAAHRAMEVVGDVLLLVSPEGLWRSDGTPAGTVAEGVRTGSLPGFMGNPVRDNEVFVALGDSLLFASADWARGAELWKWRPEPPGPAVVGRHVFYNNSAFDGHDRAAGPPDDNAVTPDPAVYVGTIAYTTVGVAPAPMYRTSHARGINGVMVDVRGLPPGAAPTASDFKFEMTGSDVPTQPWLGPRWRPVPAPASVTVRRGAGHGGADRVTLTWHDGALRNTWLRVTVGATAATGLPQPDVFYLGNLVGDVTRDGVVNRYDLEMVQSRLGSASAVTDAYDVDRDGRVGLSDVRAVRANLRRRLASINTHYLPVQLVESPNTRIESASASAASPTTGAAAIAAARKRVREPSGLGLLD